jgi:two-component system nitrate/nitrite response regulator NarL
MRVQSFATVLVGPDTLVREGLTRILRPAGFRILASVSDIDDFSPDVFPPGQPVLVIFDVGHYPRATVGQIRTIRTEHPAARVAVVADHCRPQDVVLAFQAGASSYLIKVMASAALIKSLELVMLGEAFLPLTVLPFIPDQRIPEDDQTVAPETAREKIDDVDLPQLSIREECILRYLVEGSSNKAIARKINIAEATVKVHVKAILRKIRAQNRTQAAIWAIQRGLAMAQAGSPQQHAAALPRETQPLETLFLAGAAQAEDAGLIGLPPRNGMARTAEEQEKALASRAR